MERPVGLGKGVRTATIPGPEEVHRSDEGQEGS